jgi:hypothetical protein
MCKLMDEKGSKLRRRRGRIENELLLKLDERRIPIVFTQGAMGAKYQYSDP